MINKSHPYGIEFAIQRGADINALNNDGLTPLMHAIKNTLPGYNELTCIKILMDNGADINAKGRHGESALLLSIARTHDDIFERLVSGGADILQKNNKGQSIPYLLAHSAINHNIQKSVARLTMLVDRGVDISKETYDGNSILEHAKLNGWHELVSVWEARALRRPNNNGNSKESASLGL